MKDGAVAGLPWKHCVVPGPEGKLLLQSEFQLYSLKVHSPPGPDPGPACKPSRRRDLVPAVYLERKTHRQKLCGAKGPCREARTLCLGISSRHRRPFLCPSYLDFWGAPRGLGISVRGRKTLVSNKVWLEMRRDGKRSRKQGRAAQHRALARVSRGLNRAPGVH